MKKLAIIALTISLLIVISLLFWHHRVHPSDATVRLWLVGTWVEGGGRGQPSKTITIDPDGHSVMQSSSGVRAEGTTQVKDGCLISTITNSNQPMNLPFTQSVRIIRMDEHELVLPGSANAEVAYKKVEP